MAIATEYLNDLLARGDPRCTLYPLVCLEPNTDTYTLLVLQPRENIEATDVVRNSDRESAKSKHDAFLRLAIEKHADLAVAPEYSCPWPAIEDSIRTDVLPTPGALWVLGCEGILPSDLATIAERNPTIRWYPSPDEIRALGDGSYLDPVALICKARMRTGNDVTVICTQFKNQPMSDPRHRYEPDHLCVALKRRFLLRNDEDSVRCAVLICSDTLTATIEKEVWHTDLYRPWLILHLQLCVDPRNVSFGAYRSKFYNQDLKLKEYLCVNRARGYAIAGRDGIVTFGGSGYYTKAPEADVSAARVVENHDKGLHYTWCDERKAHTYFFDYDEHVFWLSTTKAAQKIALAPDQANGRVGPTMQACFTWDSDLAGWKELPAADDGFGQLCLESACTVPALTGNALSSLDKERLIALSTGDVVKPSLPKNRWHDPRFLRAYQTGTDERLRTVVFAHDPDTPSYRHAELG